MHTNTLLIFPVHIKEILNFEMSIYCLSGFFKNIPGEILKKITLIKKA